MAGARAQTVLTVVDGPVTNDAPKAGFEQRDLLAEVFHALNQPMAGLRCTLEAALAKNRSAEQYRQHMETALEKAGEIERWTRSISEFVLADYEKEEKRQSLPLGKYVRECADDLALVAEASQVRCTINIEKDHRVWFSPRILKQMMFRIYEFALAEVGAGGAILIGDILLADVVILEYVLRNDGTTGTNAADGQNMHRQKLWLELSFATAQRVIEAAGGHLAKETSPHETKICLQLPLAES